MQHSHQTIFYSGNQTMTFSYTIFPVNKIECWKIFKIMRKSLFNYSLYSHPETGKFQGVTPLFSSPPAAVNPGRGKPPGGLACERGLGPESCRRAVKAAQGQRHGTRSGWLAWRKLRRGGTEVVGAVALGVGEEG
jgi:hypothetical protein